MIDSLSFDEVESIGRFQLLRAVQSYQQMIRNTTNNLHLLSLKQKTSWSNPVKSENLFLINWNYLFHTMLDHIYRLTYNYCWSVDDIWLHHSNTNVNHWAVLIDTIHRSNCSYTINERKDENRLNCEHYFVRYQLMNNDGRGSRWHYSRKARKQWIFNNEKTKRWIDRSNLVWI